MICNINLYFTSEKRTCDILIGSLVTEFCSKHFTRKVMFPAVIFERFVRKNFSRLWIQSYRDTKVFQKFSLEVFRKTF